MKRTRDRPTRTLPRVDPAVSDDLIDILAAVVAIVVVTVIALAF